MNPDDYIEGTHNQMNPVNWIDEELPPLTELEEQQEWNMELCQKIALMKNDLKTLKDIEEMYSMLGWLSFEEQEQKREILNKY